MADVNSENEHYQPHAESHADLPHGGQCCRGYAVALPVYGAHDCIDVGWGEEGEADANDKQCSNDVPQVGSAAQEDEEDLARLENIKELRLGKW